MVADLSELESAIDKFEGQWEQQHKGSHMYHLVIEGELNREVCKEIAKIYTNAGWTKVSCKTSSDGGERPGLTGLILYAPNVI